MSDTSKEISLRETSRTCETSTLEDSIGQMSEPDAATSFPPRGMLPDQEQDDQKKLGYADDHDDDDEDDEDDDSAVEDEDEEEDEARDMASAAGSERLLDVKAEADDKHGNEDDHARLSSLEDQHCDGDRSDISIHDCIEAGSDAGNELNRREQSDAAADSDSDGGADYINNSSTNTNSTSNKIHSAQEQQQQQIERHKAPLLQAAHRHAEADSDSDIEEIPLIPDADTVSEIGRGAEVACSGDRGDGNSGGNGDNDEGHSENDDDDDHHHHHHQHNRKTDSPSHDGSAADNVVSLDLQSTRSAEDVGVVAVSGETFADHAKECSESDSCNANVNVNANKNNDGSKETASCLQEQHTLQSPRQREVGKERDKGIDTVLTTLIDHDSAHQHHQSEAATHSPKAVGSAASSARDEEDKSEVGVDVDVGVDVRDDGSDSECDARVESALPEHDNELDSQSRSNNNGTMIDLGLAAEADSSHMLKAANGGDNNDDDEDTHINSSSSSKDDNAKSSPAVEPKESSTVLCELSTFMPSEVSLPQSNEDPCSSLSYPSQRKIAELQEALKATDERVRTLETREERWSLLALKSQRQAETLQEQWSAMTSKLEKQMHDLEDHYKKEIEDLQESLNSMLDKLKLQEGREARIPPENEKKSSEVVDLLVEQVWAPPKLNGTEPSDRPLTLAAQCGHLDVIKVLATMEGFDVNVVDKDNFTAVHQAATNGHLDVVKYLMAELGANANLRDNEHNTPLHQAVSSGHLEVAEFLLSLPDNDLEARGRLSRTPLHCAVLGRQVQIFKLLAAKGAELRVEDFRHFTPWTMAIEQGLTEIVEFMADTDGWDINVRDTTSFGQTGLHTAAHHGHLEIISFLLSKGARLNARDSHKLTPLMVGAAAGRLEVVQYLASLPECNLAQRCTKGRNARGWAQEKGHQESAAFLKTKGLKGNGVFQRSISALR